MSEFNHLLKQLEVENKTNGSKLYRATVFDKVKPSEIPDLITSLGYFDSGLSPVDTSTLLPLPDNQSSFTFFRHKLPNNGSLCSFFQIVKVPLVRIHNISAGTDIYGSFMNTSPNLCFFLKGSFVGYLRASHLIKVGGTVLPFPFIFDEILFCYNNGEANGYKLDIVKPLEILFNLTNFVGGKLQNW